MSAQITNLQRINKLNKKQILKDQKDNIVGAIDEKHNLIILNDQYTLFTGGVIKSNSESIEILNKNNFGIKINNSNIEIINSNKTFTLSTDSIQHSQLDNVKSNDHHSRYSDQEAFNACNNNINSKTINNCKISDSINSNTIWTSQTTFEHLSHKSHVDHTHDFSQIKNPPVPITKKDIPSINHLISINQVNSKLLNKSNINHTHNTFTKEEINSLIRSNIKNIYNANSDSELIEKLSLNELKFKKDLKELKTSIDQTTYFQNQLLDKKFKQFNVQISNSKAQLDHKHSEFNSIFTKPQIIDLLKSKASFNHTHPPISIPPAYSDQETNLVIDKLIDNGKLILSDQVHSLLKTKSSIDHNHSLTEPVINQIFSKLKTQIRDYLKDNFIAKNSIQLNGFSDQDFAAVNHTHPIEKHKHSDLEIKIQNIDKYTKKEIDIKFNTKSNNNHRHSVTEIINLPKQYTDRDTNIFMQSMIKDIENPSTYSLYSSQKINQLVNTKSPTVHQHTLTDIKEIKGYITSTVDMAVNNNRHIHRMIDIVDKPKPITNDYIQTLMINDVNESKNNTWSAHKIKIELEYLYELIQTITSKSK